MALTIEDGTGVTGADSFASLVEYEASQVALYGAVLGGADEVAEAALRRAWYFMKSLSWTTASDYPTFDATIPADIKAAQSILARAEEASPGALQPTVTPGQQKVLSRVGDISWTVTGASGTDAQRAVVTMAMDLLKPYLSDLGQTKFLARG